MDILCLKRSHNNLKQLVELTLLDEYDHCTRQMS